MPMFHGMGIMQTAWTVRENVTIMRYLAQHFYVSKAMSGIVLSVFQPRSPAIISEPDSVMKASMATRSDIIFCVPSFVEVSLRFLS